MALIIEDGSIVEGANSYATREQIIDYAAARGVTFNLGSPADEALVDILAIGAMDYLESFRGRFIGQEVEPGIQPLSWPRECVKVGRYTYPSDEIPRNIISAQCQLCIYINSGVSLLPVSGNAAFVKREKIGPIETEYSEAVQLAAGSLPTMPAIDALLGPFLDGGGGRLRAVRI